MNAPQPLQDGFGRRFPYLRLSVTEACGFRCSYCLPNGYKPTARAPFLSTAEIQRLVTAFAAMGTWKVRLTGGEPTARADFCELARTVANIGPIRRLAMTTNGDRLAERAQLYRDAGVDAINISLDSLDRARYQQITGRDKLAEVVAGVDAALGVGFDAVKVNAVLLKDKNAHELEAFLDFIAQRPVSLRLIELMQTGDNLAYFRAHHLSAAVVQAQLVARGWQALPRQEGAGPAVEYAHPGYRGTIGLIAPYSKDFCAGCNRVRVSARGELHLCLFGAGGYSIRHLLQHDNQQAELQALVHELMLGKRAAHALHTGDSGARPHLASVGG